jgi:galactonate dehydratase
MSIIVYYVGARSIGFPRPHAIRRGYTAFKIDPFGAGSYEMSEEEKVRSVDIIAAVRKAVGPAPEIFIQMHDRIAAQTAIDL